MTEIENRIINDINLYKEKVKLFWDMDGTCTSMEMHKKDHKTEKGFFYSKRPIKTMIRIMESLHNLGATTYILSYCSFNYQKEDKEKWLKENCTFINPNNYIIIPRREKDVKVAESKVYLKAEYIKEHILPDDIIYMIDDNEPVLLGTKEILPNINIVSPIDFID